MKKIISFAAILLLGMNLLSAKVILPDILSDGMVLQRNSQTSLWGKAKPGTKIRIRTSWNKLHYKAIADQNGAWMVKVQTPEAGGPYSIEFNDGDKVTINDVLIGEVWLCSGQSNMEMPMKGFMNQPIEGATDIIISAKESTPIRICNIQKKTSIAPVEECHGKWKTNIPEHVANSSATAYLFAKKIHEVTGLPIGIINSSWGGTPIQAWMNKETISKSFPEIGINCLKTGKLPKNRPQNYPTSLFNGMISPLVPYDIKGIIWYQGEANRWKPEQYRRLEKEYVGMMRKLWQKEDLPFYYVQIAPYRYDDPDGMEAAALREAQLQNLDDIKHSGMVVTMDIGDATCIHPAKKIEVGNRLAYMALVNDYGYKGIDPNAPRYQSWKVEDGKIIVKFKVGKDGLAPLGRTLKGFEVAGEDKVFYPATGKIRREEQGSLVEVTCAEVEHPVAVRYCFKNVEEGTLFNNYGIPASPFRTDDWKVINK